METLTERPVDAWQRGRELGLRGEYAAAAEQFERAVRADATLSHVEFAVADRVVSLRDVAGSPWAASVLAELGADMYGLADLAFAPGAVVLDIGAHIGVVSVVLATLRPDLRIIAYEPSSSNYAMLCENLAANDITNVTPVQAAVMAEPGEMTLTWGAHATAGSIVGLTDEARAARESHGWMSERVRCVTLDHVFSAHGIDRCSWLKLDCEAAEWGIVATTGVLERVDRMSMELHLPASRAAEGADRCVQDFAKLLQRVARPPVTVVSSTVWMTDI